MITPEATSPHQPGTLTHEEWLQWALENPTPGDLLHDLVRTGNIGLYPELAGMVDVPQDPEWHPEGPVHVHVAHVVNAAAEIAEREGLTREARLILMLGALTHDLGKAVTTVLRKKRDGRMRWTSYNHDRAGVPITRRFLRGAGFNEELIRQVTPLVETHMEYRQFQERQASQLMVRRLALRIYPATMRQLGWVIEADHSGRPPLPKRVPDGAVRMMRLAEEAGVLDGLPRTAAATP